MAGTNASDIEEWKHIIAELCVNAPDETVRNCIRLYDPTKPSSQIKKKVILNFLNFPGPYSQVHTSKLNIFTSNGNIY